MIFIAYALPNTHRAAEGLANALAAAAIACGYGRYTRVLWWTRPARVLMAGGYAAAADDPMSADGQALVSHLSLETIATMHSAVRDAWRPPVSLLVELTRTEPLGDAPNVVPRCMDGIPPPLLPARWP